MWQQQYHQTVLKGFEEDPGVFIVILHIRHNEVHIKQEANQEEEDTTILTALATYLKHVKLFMRIIVCHNQHIADFGMHG